MDFRRLPGGLTLTAMDRSVRLAPQGAGGGLIPGFVDPHGHIVMGGIQALSANLQPPPDGPFQRFINTAAVYGDFVRTPNPFLRANPNLAKAMAAAPHDPGCVDRFMDEFLAMMALSRIRAKPGLQRLSACAPACSRVRSSASS
jgi:hypothetical protein